MFETLATIWLGIQLAGMAIAGIAVILGVSAYAYLVYRDRGEK